MKCDAITICNRLGRESSQTGLDVWFVTKIEDVEYKVEKVTTVNGSTTSIGEVITVLIPFTGKYKSYIEWKDSVNKSEYFTMNQGDLIFLNDISTMPITNSNIITLKNKYKSKCCEVRSIMEVPSRVGIKYQLKVSGV